MKHPLQPFACLLAAALLAAAPTLSSAQGRPSEKEKGNRGQPKEEKTWQPVTVDAGVLRFGAELEEAATPALKNWMGGYVKKTLRDQPLVPKNVIEAVDARYASASDLARDAGIYLVYFLAYKDDEENQRMLGFRIRDIDRETYDITRELNIAWESEQNRLASTQNPSLTPQERIRREELEQKRNARLRELGDERQLKATQVAFSRKKVNLYLRLMAAAYEKMKGTDPGILRELK